MYKKWDLVSFDVPWLKWEAVIKGVLEEGTEWSVNIYEAETLYNLEGDETAWTGYEEFEGIRVLADWPTYLLTLNL